MPIEAAIVGKSIRLKTPYAMKDRCTAIPGGKWLPKYQAWEYHLTPATANAIFGLFNGALPPNVYDVLQKARTVFDVGPGIKALGPDDTPDIPIYKTPPWHHQKVAYHYASSILFNAAGIGGGVLLGLDMGCGKTYCAISIIANHTKEIKSVLIVCPHSVVDVWPLQFKNHSDLNPVIVALGDGPGGKKMSVETKQHLAELSMKSAAMQRRMSISVINYESLWREPFASWALDTEFDMVVLDELHRIKAAKGKTTKFCEKMGRTVPYRLGLTGTPLPHSPLDVFGQYRFLDAGIFGTTVTKFRSDYAVMGGFENHQVLNFKNLDNLAAKMYSIGYRVMSKDVFDLPPFQDITRTFQMTPEDMSLYRQMEEEFCVQLKDEIITADNALVKILRLQEMTSGFLAGNLISNGKKNLLDDTIEDFPKDEPLVIFARFTNDLVNVKAIAEKQGRRYAELSGNAHDLAMWQKGQADVLGVQIKSGREGVDFTRARYCLYYSLGHSLGDYNQSRKRVDRPGQVREGAYYHLIAKGTIDEVVMKALAKREEVVESVLRHYKEIINMKEAA